MASASLYVAWLSIYREIATHPGIFTPPSPRVEVEVFIDTCLIAPAATAVRADAGHWAIVRDLCTKAACCGNVIQNAYLAALAIQHNCTYVTADGDHARFPGLRWRHPLD